LRTSFLPFSTPSVGEEEITEVAETLRSGWITSGPKTRRFEQELSEYNGSQYTIAVSSCTAGLHSALAALGIGPDDDVIVPTLTFCSSANVVVHLGARPVLVDVGMDFNVTAETIEKAITENTKAIMVVHFGGLACDLETIDRIAERHGVALVQDAAHAIGSEYHGAKIGSDVLAARGLNDVTVFSFYPTKNMTTGEGGMIATASEQLAQKMRLLTLHGLSRSAWTRNTSEGSWYYEVTVPGYKYNMTDIQASLGIHQLRRLDAFISTRQQYASLYDQAFADMPEIVTPITYADRSHAYHLYVIRLHLERLTINRDQFIEELRLLNIGSSVHFIPVHLHPFYRKTFDYRPGDFPVAEDLYQQIISLPLFPRMTREDVESVIDGVRKVVRNNKKRADRVKPFV